TSTTTDPLIDLSGGSVSYGASGGSLLTVNGGSITTSGGLVRASGVMFVPTSGQPLINVVGGSVTVGGPLFELSGTLNLGSGPLADPVVFSDGGDFGADITVTAGAAFRVTSGTLTAKSLYASAGNGESLTINGPFREITTGARH